MKQKRNLKNETDLKIKILHNTTELARTQELFRLSLLRLRSQPKNSSREDFCPQTQKLKLCCMSITEGDVSFS